MRGARVSWLKRGRLMAVLCFAGCSEPERAEVEVDGIGPIHAPGYIEPAGRLRNLSFGTDGRILSIGVGIGQSVARGELLGELESNIEKTVLEKSAIDLSIAQAELARVKAGVHPERLAALRVGVEEAASEQRYRKAEADRLHALFMDDGISQKEADLATHQADLASSRLSIARARLREAETQVRPEELVLAQQEVKRAQIEQRLSNAQLERRSLHAPSDGRILEIYQRAGEATPGGPVLLFAPEGPPIVRAEVDEEFVGRVAVGQHVRVRIRNEAGTELAGVISKVKPVMGKKRVFTREARERIDLRVFEVFVELSGPARDLPFGLEVEVVIDLKEGS